MRAIRRGLVQRHGFGMERAQTLRTTDVSICMLEELTNIIDLQTIATKLVEFTPHLIASFAILVAGYVLFRLLRALTRRGLRRVDFDETLTSLFADKVLRYVVLTAALIMALDQLGIDVTTALAGVGVLGIAVGFAAQDAVGNVIAGFLIFWDKPFQVGDWIQTEDEFGQVTNITLRTTRIRTPRNTYVVIPNKRIIDEVLENYTKHGELRVDVSVGIAYRENIAQAREVILEAVSAIDEVLSKPGPDVVVSELGASSVNLAVRVWIESAGDFRRIRFAVTETAKIALDEAGIEIPFPHLQLHVDDVDTEVLDAIRQTG